MTGFPGETDTEFDETVRFIEQQPFTYLHVFTYSERPGTAAVNLPDPVPVSVRHERTQALRALGVRKNEEFRRRMIGRTLTAVTLEQPGTALTTNFTRVKMNRTRPANQILDLNIAGIDATGLLEASAFPILK
jgi:threonylcarbamoyladenosine tRNA methylthiotransferase MtaB